MLVWEAAYQINRKIEANLMIALDNWGVGISLIVGDFTVFFSVDLLIFHLTLFFDKGRKTKLTL